MASAAVRAVAAAVRSSTGNCRDKAIERLGQIEFVILAVAVIHGIAQDNGEIVNRDVMNKRASSASIKRPLSLYVIGYSG